MQSWSSQALVNDNILSHYACAVINTAVAEEFCHKLLAGGGAASLQSITREQITSARQETKARDNALVLSTLNIDFDVIGRVKIRSNTQNWTIGFAALETPSGAPVTNSARIMHNQSPKCCMCVRLMRGSVSPRSGSKSGYDEQKILPQNKSWYHVIGHWRVELDGDADFVIWVYFRKKNGLNLQMAKKYFFFSQEW